MLARQTDLHNTLGMGAGHVQGAGCIYKWDEGEMAGRMGSKECPPGA